MRKYLINERYTVLEESQKIFNTTKPYAEDCIVVHLNGILLSSGKEEGMYTQVDNYTIKLNTPAVEGDVVTITSLYNAPNLSIKVVSGNNKANNSIYKKFGQKERLMTNQSYKACVNINGIEFKWGFNTKLEPYLITIKRIRLDTGDLLEGVSDYQICSIIYENSKTAIEKYQAYVEEADDDEISADVIPKAVKRWARYKTDIDLCYAIYLSMSGKYGEATKKLGNITVTNDVELPEIDTMIARFKNELADAEAEMTIVADNCLAFVKAGNTSYTIDTERMSF